MHVPALCQALELNQRGIYSIFEPSFNGPSSFGRIARASAFAKTVSKELSCGSSINIDPSNITPEQLAEFNKVQGGLSGALKSLLVTVERYPDLKANQNFLKLQDELAST